MLFFSSISTTKFSLLIDWVVEFPNSIEVNEKTGEYRNSNEEVTTDFPIFPSLEVVKQQFCNEFDDETGDSDFDENWKIFSKL